MRREEQDREYLKGIEVIQSRPGRISLEIARMRGNSTLAAELEARFSAIAGIRRVEADAAHGKVAILYNQNELTSLHSRLAMQEAFSSLFPEIKPLALAGYLRQML
jgi:hypothetical protein